MGTNALDSAPETRLGMMRGQAINIALALAGFGLLAISLGLEVLRIGSPELGTMQIGIALAGFTLLLIQGWRRSTATDRTSEAIRYLVVAAEVAVVVLILTGWRVESPDLFLRLAPLVFLGFLVHHSLPLPWRPAFFLILSFTAIGVIFGPGPGGLMVAVGLMLVAICHLPVSFALRVGLLIAVGTALVLMRASLLPWNLPAAIWPILASMFMFRLINYVYDLRHGNAPPRLAQRLSYFFMLPNVVFPLYPVVDSSTYHRRYYDKQPWAIYQEGIGWMLRGAIHLLIYRLIYQRLTIAPADVLSATDLVQFLVTTFGLYLRVSGQFHFIVGVLHLFGHRLPETHKLYFLSSSFTDFWRRINIYWKDFIQKLFFYPVYFRIRKRGETFGLVMATLVAFFATWLFHSYQWFWILGKPLFSVTDTLFWAVLAVLVVINVLVERKRGRIRKLDDRGFSAREILSLGLRTGTTFVFLCVLWGLWNSATLSEFLSLFAGVNWRSSGFFLLLGGVLGGAILLAAVARYVTSLGLRLGEVATASQFNRQAGFAGVGMALFLGLTYPALTLRVPVEAQLVLRDLQSGELNTRDAELVKRGYYENLMAVNRWTSRVWEYYAERPKDWQFIARTPAGRWTNDFLEKELVPGASAIFHGAAVKVNRWGMRDRDYEQVPPQGSYRIALLGASYTMGSAVTVEETFGAIVEDRLNQEMATKGGSYEILNFAVPGYNAAQQVLVVERRVLGFSPDAVWLTGYPKEYADIVHHLKNMVQKGTPMPWPFLEEIIREVGATRDMSDEELTRRLDPKGMELLAWAYGEIARQCREAGIRPVWIFLPGTGTPRPEESFAELLPLAREAGFEIVDLSNVYAGETLENIVIASYDDHPNPRGHRIIARQILEALQSRPELLRRDTASRE